MSDVSRDLPGSDRSLQASGRAWGSPLLYGATAPSGIGPIPPRHACATLRRADAVCV